MSDTLFMILVSLIIGTTGVMLIIAFVFSSKEVRRKPLKENLEKIPKISRVYYPANFKKYRIDVIIEGKKGKVIRYGPDYISINRELIKEFRTKGIQIETGCFKELDRKLS
jgi:flagellar basal body-associated protein FliL